MPNSKQKIGTLSDYREIIGRFQEAVAELSPAYARPDGKLYVTLMVTRRRSDSEQTETIWNYMKLYGNCMETNSGLTLA